MLLAFFLQKIIAVTKVSNFRDYRQFTLIIFNRREEGTLVCWLPNNTEKVRPKTSLQGVGSLVGLTGQHKRPDQIRQHTCK